jgi:hypothetical protein
LPELPAPPLVCRSLLVLHAAKPAIAKAATAAQRKSPRRSGLCSPTDLPSGRKVPTMASYGRCESKSLR